MEDSLRHALEAALGARIVRAASVGGGDINEAHRVELVDGRRVFVKSHAHAPPRMFTTEAEGLDWLREAQALKVPVVLAVQEPAHPHGAGFLALENIEAGPRPPDFGERFGRGLAALHRSGAPRFGWTRNNFIGTLPQSNEPVSGNEWARFYGERRLEPQLRHAVDAGHVPARLAAALGALLARLPDLVGPPEPPARLHGDLWGGNHMASASGEPVIFDPAVYGGHREMDLAMMRLFGGYEPRTFAAYEEAFPLAPGHGARVPLCQLYPLLVHVNLFQGSYVSQLETALRAARGP